MERVLPVASFTTRSLDPDARYDGWRDLISTVFEPTLPTGQRRADVRAEVRSVHFGNALITDAEAEAHHFIRSPRLIAIEPLDHYMIQIYRYGVCDGTYGDTQNTVRPGDVKLLDLARPFNTCNTDFANTTLTIPRAMLAPLLDRPDALHGRVLPGSSPLGQVVASHVLTLSATAASFDAIDGAAVAAATIRLLAACLGANTRRRDETRPFAALAIGQAIRSFIEEQLHTPSLDPDLLARRFRMSRTQLYRLFAEEGGVAAFIQTRRLRRCFLALTDPAQAGRGSGEIALGLGFGSEAHFSRAFRRAFGLTPGEARACAVPPAPVAGSFINDWMRSLDRRMV